MSEERKGSTPGRSRSKPSTRRRAGSSPTAVTEVPEALANAFAAATVKMADQIVDGVTKAIQGLLHQQTTTSPAREESTGCTTSTAAQAAQADAIPLPGWESSRRPDDWIDGGAIEPAATQFHAGWLQDLAPAVRIEPFDGDPLKWDSFISSFKALVHDTVRSNAQRLAILRQLLAPTLRDNLVSPQAGPEMYEQILRDLRRLYGDQDATIEACVTRLMTLEPAKSCQRTEIERFYLRVHGVVNVLKARQSVELNSRAIQRTVVARLPMELRNKWAKRCHEMRPEQPTLIDFDRWLEDIVMVNNQAALYVEPTSGEAFASKPSPGKERVPKHTHSARILATTQIKCSVCGGAHVVAECDIFVKATFEQRRQIVVERRLCFTCLQPGHRSSDCGVKNSCPVAGCRGRHHRLLHGCSFPRRIVETQPPSEVTQQVARVGVTAMPAIVDRIFLPVLPVMVVSKSGHSVATFALLDGGSQATLVTEELIDKLHLEKGPAVVRLSTFHGQDPAIELATTSFKLTSADGSAKFNIEKAVVVPTLNVAGRAVNWQEQRSAWPHLKDLPLSVVNYGRVSMLIGVDNFDVMEPLEVRRSLRGNGPYGIRTPLGWSVVGPTGMPSDDNQSPLVNNVSVQLAESDRLLKNLLERFWTTDSFGVRVNVERCVAKQAMEMAPLAAACSYDGQRYRMALLWRDDHVTLPNNRSMALQRFMSLRSKLIKDGELFAAYKQGMAKMLQHKTARKVRLEELGGVIGKTWYLPHHPVRHPNKQGKVRIVFDASARYGGISLNDCLTKGPDLSHSLIGVLLRFRRYQVAAIAYIDRMYHQVEVADDDQGVLRFLWTDKLDKAPETYVMQRQVFGLVSAPASCIYALNQCIRRHCSSELAADLESRFYVDNYMDSFQTAQAANIRCQQISAILMSGSFPLAQWASNDNHLLRNLAAPERPFVTMSATIGDDQPEQALGLLWDCKTDSLMVRIPKEAATAFTKRQLLQIVASIFDPLGLLAPTVVPAKIMMREATCLKGDWDDQLPDAMIQRLTMWSAELHFLAAIKIPRWYGLNDEVISAELHVFADASEQAFGAVAYLRCVYVSGMIRVALVMAKSRLAPRKPLTIPRLELQAAVLAVRLKCMVVSELQIDLEQVIFWTDAQTVLRWLAANDVRFKTFVLHRVTEILDESNVQQWRHVPGRLNPADDLSRGLSPNKLSADHRWFRGPPFLYEAEQNWPQMNLKSALPSEDVEYLRAIGYCNTEPKVMDNVILHLADVMSNLSKIIRVLAYVRRFCKLTSFRGMEISPEEYDNAGKAAIRLVQAVFFTNEIGALQRQRQLSAQSCLLSVDPFLDKDGILRVGGRLHRASVSQATAHPIVLPKDCSFVHRLIWHRHLQLMHCGPERVLASLRAEYWPIGGRRTIRKVLGKCFYCRRMNARPLEQKMARLPAERLSHQAPAFANVGIDVFGPFMVVVKRSTVKRYGCLFTCLTTRACHLEVLHSMDVDSFLLAFRRFVARRGRPRTIFCDNGRNFVGAERNLRRAYTQWAKCHDITQPPIYWKFSVPAAPHHGGVWERLIAIAKRALAATLNGNAVTDEVLVTVMAEAEAVLNGRPLAYVGNDPEMPVPLTPFDLLIGRPNIFVPADLCCEDGCTMGRHWRMAQDISDRFWRRWLREVLPGLQTRPKWLRNQRNLSVGDVAALIDPSTPRGQWPIGRIVEVIAGADGCVRSARIRLKGGTYARPISRLVQLDEAI